jgi:hypothetical protein
VRCCSDGVGDRAKPQPQPEPEPEPKGTREASAAQNSAARRLGQGWVPAEHVQVLARRPAGAAMVAGTSDWMNELQAGSLDESMALLGGGGGGDIAGRGGGLAEPDREVAKLLAYQQILACRRQRGIETPLFLAEAWLDHPTAHALATLLLGAHALAVARLAPSALQLLLGVVLGFVAVDLLSTAYHLCLDYALLSTATVNVTDLHHKLPLNYNLFTPRKLLATSYVAVVPMHAVHLLLHGALALAGVGASPTLAAYTGSAALLGCSCGFVHNAAHRRRHELPISGLVWLLQDLGLLLHPDVHSAHHREAHDRCVGSSSTIRHFLCVARV